MMVDIREIFYRKLLLSKQFYKHGVTHSENSAYVDRCLSIHHFHLSVDIVLISIIDYYNVSLDTRNPRSLSFRDKIDKINNHFKADRKRIPYHNKMLGLNDQRNNVQHEATAPDYETIKEYLKFSELFLREAFRLFFSQDFDKISEISLIEDTTLRHIIEIIKEFVEKKEYQKSINGISQAYLLSSDSIGKNIDFGPKMVHESHPIYIDGIRMDGYTSTTEEVSRDIEKIQFLVGLGISQDDYDKFTNILPHCYLAIDGTVNLIINPNRQFTYEETVWALDFFIQIILRWQNRGLIPRIQKGLEIQF